jgi:hydroxyacylglutathione hydrolase
MNRLGQTDVQLSPHVTVLIGQDGGKYPHGNSVLVSGSLGTVLIDPSLTVSDRGGVGTTVDRVLVSHAHEDHMAGLHLFGDASVHTHSEDLLGVQSLDGLLTVYGMSPSAEAEWRTSVMETFHFRARADATGFTHGDVFDLGGVQVRCVHLAGHTRGHSGFFVEPDGVFFVGDIDLTGFGPYYGDHWSSLNDFEASIATVRNIEAASYVTFHQKGIVQGRARFTEMLDAFRLVIDRREHEMLTFLAEPRTMDDMVEHRFMYRRGVHAAYFDDAERRCTTLHLERLIPSGAVIELAPGLFRAA